MPPMALINGEPQEMEPLQPGPTVDFGEPIGEAETIYTLHSEVLTFGESFGATNVTFALSLRRRCWSSCASWSGASEERDSRGGALRIAPLAAHGLRPPRRGPWSTHGTRQVAGASVTPPARGVGLGGGIVSTASPAAAAVRLLARGRITATGAMPPERCIDPDEMFAELETRGVRFECRRRRAAESRATRGRPMKVGVPTEIKEDEYRVAMTPAGVRELAEHGHEVLIQAGRRRGQRDLRRRVRRPGRAHRPRRRGGLRRGRDGAQGEGAPAPRGRDAARGPDPVHLPAPGARPRADQGPAGDRARPASPTRPSRTSAAGCRCWRR